MKPWIGRLLGPLLSFALVVPAASGMTQSAQTGTQSITLTLPQARTVARAALAEGRPQLAYRMGETLLAADPRDPEAYYLIAQALQQMKNPALGRRAAGYAFRYSDRPIDRFATAQLAAQLSYQAGQYTRAQYWLRRSLDVAPNQHLHDQAIRDFKRVRAENPLSFRLRLALEPSNNVNSGAATNWLTIDGEPEIGLAITSDGQALSGLVATAGLSASYRLRRSKTSETRALFNYNTRQVFLSSEARRKLAAQPQPPYCLPGFPGYPVCVPVPGNSDFSSSNFHFGIEHSFRLGQGPEGEGGNGYGLLALTGGQYRYAQSPYFNFTKLRGERGFALGRGSNLRLGGEVEWRHFHRRGGKPALLAELRADYTRGMQSGAQLSTGLTIGKTISDAINTDQTRATAYVNYRPARRIGTARLSLTMGAGIVDYPDYRLLMPIPGGRDDRSLFGSATMHFDKLDFAGFSPAVTMRARRSDSNISRFDTRELTLSIGIQSNF